MSYAIAKYPPLIRGIRTGAGPEAKNLDEIESEFQSSHSPSFSENWKEYLKEDAVRIFLEKQEENWNDEDAFPIKFDSFITITKFIDQLPDEIEEPEIGAEPDGSLALEWHSSSGKILAITLSKGTINYAGYFGPSKKQHGMEPLNDEIPETINTILHKFFPRER